MSALTFTLKTMPDFPVNLSALVPVKLSGKSMEEIRATKLPCGNQSITVASLFSIRGKDSEHIRFRQSCARLTNIGEGLNSGIISIEGDVGDYLGKGMHAGRIDLLGNAGNSLGSGMSGGNIEVQGNVGDFLAGPLTGESLGMNDGTIVIHGNAGHRVAEYMRRGMIIIHGDVGDYCANRMIAGTIIILGKTGTYLGFCMKRGTIVLAKKPRQLLATFRHCGLLKIEFLRLLFKQLAHSNKQFTFFKDFGPEAIRYAGDISCDGLGEILLLKNARIPK